MPSLQGYEVRTHSLPGGREVDILHRPNQIQYLWIPGQQALALTGDGLRADGYYSTSDVAKTIDPLYVRKEPDPHLLYSKSRVRHTTLYAIEGLIQRMFRTDNPRYVRLCREFIEYVLPEYRDFGRYHAELIMVCYEAIDCYEATSRWLLPSRFQDAVKARDARLVKDPNAASILVLGTEGCDRVLCVDEPNASDDGMYLTMTPLGPSESVSACVVADLVKARDRAGKFRNRYPDMPVIVPRLVIIRPGGSIWTTGSDEQLIADGKPATSQEPPPEAEQPVDRPLPGVPAIFNGVDCPAFGTYEDPRWVGLYVCDVLGLANPHQALSRVPDEDKGVLIVSTPGGPQAHVVLAEAGVYRLIATSRKPEAEAFRNWLFRIVLPSIRRYGAYVTNGARVGLTAEEVREIIRTLLNEKIEPIAQAVRAHNDQAHQEAVIKLLTLIAEQSLETMRVNQEHLKLTQQSIDLLTPSHQLLLPASDYFELDDIREALKRAPRLAVPSFGLDHCPDFGRASLWMKLLCREEDKKVAKNEVDRQMAKYYGQEVPPLYIPEFRMEKRERDHVQVLMFNPACWVRLKQTFLPADTLPFPGPKTKPVSDTDATGKTEEA